MLNSQRVNLHVQSLWCQSLYALNIICTIYDHVSHTKKKKCGSHVLYLQIPRFKKKCSEGCKLTVCPCSNRWAPWCPKIIVPYYSIYCFHVFILEFWHSAVQAPIILAMVKSAAKHTPSVINPILGEGNRKLKLLETGLYTIKVPVHQAQKLWLIYC